MNGPSGLNAGGVAKLEELRADYERVTGEPFEAFYCPILFRDEEVELCRAHLINQAFRRSHRGWTIQRKDVDSFYGSAFENDFLVLQERGIDNPFDALSDRRLSRRLRPSITVEDDEVEHYLPKGPVPEQHSMVSVETSAGPVELVLKMEPSELLARVSQQWEVRVDRDLRLSTLASVLKAAHLTLFSLLGYSYGLSAGGHFVGRTILGQFFDEHRGKKRAAIVEAGETHFPEFVNMVRPILDGAGDLKGTASDGRLYLCGAGSPWAVLVIVRTAEARHAVLIPVLSDPEASSAHFVSFLTSPPGDLIVRAAEFKGDRFDVSPRTDRFQWPAANYHTWDF